ncbi:MAG: zinc-dependent metalloprotease [Candidatus Velthaea sp.]
MFLRRMLFGALSLVAACISFAAAQGTEAPATAASPLPTSTVSPLPSVTPAPEPTGSPTAAATTAPSASVPAPAFPFPFPLGSPAATAQNYATFVRNAELQTGVIDLIRKDDDLYFDLSPANFDKTYIISPSLASGVGSGAFAGRVYEPFLVTFKRVGKRVLWISPNTRYVAQKGSAAANSLAISVADSVLLSSPIVAEDPMKRHVVIAPSLFLTDFEGIGADLGHGVSGPSLPGLLLLGARASFAVDTSKSYYLRTKAFPRNDEVSVNLTFNGPANALPTVPDGRGIPLVVHYSIVAPPERDANFVPRYADDRVGYFITARKRYDNDALATPFERFIDRWNLESGPITFYMTNEIPQRYRPTVRRAILAWNDAFARVGRPHAIEVKDQPADPSWDPEDARYTTVRWITSDRSEFAAYSPSVVDPNTGQIIRAEVVIDGESLRSIKRGYVDTIVPTRRARASTMQAANAEIESFGQDLCQYESGSLSQAALGSLMLAMRPHAALVDRERYAEDWLYGTVLHEVGHTLGLRHNFAGSTAYTPAQLHDPNFTRTHGTTASVMAYTPVNLAGPGKRQADFFPTRLGVYDYWAIEYGYRRFAGTRASADELPNLLQIAARSTQPGLAYGTDEDATDPIALDPRILRFNLSSDPLAYNREQLALNEAIARNLDKPYPGDTRSYAEVRQSLVTVLNNELSASELAAHYIGGIYTSRAHRGQPGAPAPFRSIPRSEQRRAFDLIDRYVLSSQAFQYSPRLLNELTTTRYGFHWNSGGLRRPDFPLREVVAEIQDNAITTMFSPAVMTRIADQSLKTTHHGETMDLSDLFAWTNGAVFDDLGTRSIAPTHRDLQRRFADLEMQIALLPSFAMDILGLPRETQSLARSNLRTIERRLSGALAAAADSGTRAHLDDLRSRIRGALDPRTLRPL